MKKSHQACCRDRDVTGEEIAAVPERNPTHIELSLKLFNRSPLKQKKLEMISKLLPPLHGLRALDVGSDNGVISYLLREMGGEWHSADLDEDTVSAIRGLVQSNVVKLTEDHIPYPDRYFDLVVLIDILEHLENDHAFVAELRRVLKPGGRVIINVPNPKEGLLRKFRYFLGQTDEVHGHIRPGYDIGALQALFGGEFEFEQHYAYSRVFAELIDTFITFGLDLLKGGARGKKGRVVTGSELQRMQKSFRLYSYIAPLVSSVMFFDRFVPFLHGNMFIARVRVRG